MALIAVGASFRTAPLEVREKFAYTASEVDGPEPSPLFWDHFSARVRDAVAAEAVRRRSWFGDWNWTQLLTTVSAGAVAALLVAVALNSRAIDRRSPAGTALQPASLVADAGAQVELLSDPTMPR